MWLWLGVLSALFLGLYDVARKWSLQNNAVMPVLFFACCAGAGITGTVLLLSALFPDAMSQAGLLAHCPGASTHGRIFLKSLLVASSWMCAYYAMRHLPISIVAPIRSSSPMWTIAGAVLLMQESMSLWQWTGVLVTFGSYYAFSVIGRAEGISFLRNRWVVLVFGALFTGAMSSLYDKYLLQRMALDPVTLQVWFSLYLVLVVGVTLGLQRRWFLAVETFQWRYSILLIGVLLILSDYLYFRALSDPEALISILSTVRRSSVVVAFGIGGIVFSEKNRRRKLIPLVGILSGMLLLLRSS